MTARKPVVKKPAPKVDKTVCDVCDQDWALHGDTPTLEKCVELLKAQLRAKANSGIQFQSAAYPLSNIHTNIKAVS